MPALGANAALYYLNGSAEWIRIVNVRDLTVQMEADAFDETQRDATWKESDAGPISAALAFDLIAIPGDAALTALRDAFLNEEPIDLLALDGATDDPTSNAAGIWLRCAVTKFMRSERIRDAIGIAIVAKPTISDEDPSWVEVLIDLDNGQIVTDLDNGELVLVTA